MVSLVNFRKIGLRSFLKNKILVWQLQHIFSKGLMADSKYFGEIHPNYEVFFHGSRLKFYQ